MTVTDRGGIVAWSHNGTVQYGVLEGREGDRAFVRRLDGNRADRERLLPKPSAALLPLYTAEELVVLLRQRAKQVLADTAQTRDTAN